MNAKSPRIWPLLFFATFVGLVRQTFAEKPVTPRPQTGIIEDFDIAKGGDVIVLPVTLGEKQYPFVLSIASPRTVVDVRLRRTLGNSVGRLDDPLDSMVFEQFPALPMSIGSQSFTPTMPVLCGNLRDLHEGHGHEVFGIVGLDFLKGRVVQIDFDRGKLRILSAVPEAEDLPKDSRRDVLLSENPETPGPYGLAFCLGETPECGVFKIDTLFSQSFTVGTTFMEALVRTGTLSKLQRTSLYQSGTFCPQENRIGLVNSASLALAKFSHRQLTVLERDSECVGLAYLSRFMLTLNFRGSKSVYLSPGERFDKPELFNWTGMEVILKNGKVTAALVLPESVASVAGVEPGDVILMLDERESGEFSLFEIRRHFMEQNVIHVKFHRPERGGNPASEFAVTIASPKPIPPLIRHIKARR